MAEIIGISSVGQQSRWCQLTFPVVFRGSIAFNTRRLFWSAEAGRQQIQCCWVKQRLNILLANLPSGRQDEKASTWMCSSIWPCFHTKRWKAQQHGAHSGCKIFASLRLISNYFPQKRANRSFPFPPLSEFIHSVYGNKSVFEELTKHVSLLECATNPEEQLFQQLPQDFSLVETTQKSASDCERHACMQAVKSKHLHSRSSSTVIRWSGTC